MTLFRRCLLLLLTLALCLPLAGCALSGPATVEDTVFAMDTVISLRLYGARDAARAALDEAAELLRRLDDRLSVTKPDSEIAAIGNAAVGTPVTLSSEVAELIACAMALSALCDDAFTVTVAPLRALWKSAAAQDRLPTEEELAAALALVGDTHLLLEGTTLQKDAAGVSIDLGGIAKGYATDRLISLFTAREGITGGVISFGSSVAVFGQKPDGSSYRIGIRNPADTAAVLGYLPLAKGEFLSVSGDYERFYTIGDERYGHILDPMTGHPPTNGLRSVAVIAGDGTTADALSTALMVLGEEAGRALYERGEIDFEALFVYDDHHSGTPGFGLE